MTTGGRRAWLDLAVAALAGTVALAIYVRSLAPGLLWGDSAEFQMAGWLGGFAHPTGYPLYLMLGWLWTHLLPTGDPAYRMNLFSSLWGAVAVALLALLVMRLLRFLSGPDPAGRARPNVASRLPDWPGRLIALGAALVFTFAPTFWSQAVVAEVYTLHAAFVAGVLLSVLTWAERVLAGDAAAARRVGNLTALLFGLSLAHHRSTILLLPALGLFVVVVLNAAPSRPAVSMRRAGALVLCVLAPLLLYLFIPLRAPYVPYYRLPLGQGQSLQLYDSTLAGFLAHVSGSVFGSSLQSPQSANPSFTELAGRFIEQFSPNGVLLGAFGLFALGLLAVRDRNRRGWAVIALTGAFFVTQIAFNLLYAIGDIHVFYIPAYLIWILWMAFGVWAILLDGVWLFQSGGERARGLAVGLGAVLATAVLLAFAYRSAVVFWPRVQASTNNSARTAWEALLKSNLPENAVLVSNDRDEMVPLFYLAFVEGRRPDLTGLFPLIAPGEAWSSVGRVLDRALATGRPVRLVKPMAGLETKAALTAAAGERAGGLGPAMKVEPYTVDADRREANLNFANTVRLAGLSIEPEALGVGSPATVTLYWQPLAPLVGEWTTFVQIIDSNGDKVGQSDHKPGGEYYPTSMWVVGEELRDRHTMTLAPDPAPGPYRILVGLYSQEADGLRYLGEPQFIGAR